MLATAKPADTSALTKSANGAQDRLLPLQLAAIDTNRTLQSLALETASVAAKSDQLVESSEKAVPASWDDDFWNDITKS